MRDSPPADAASLTAGPSFALKASPGVTVSNGGDATIAGVPDEFLVMCPYCGEHVDIFIEEDVRGSFVQDCEVCCNPWRVRVTGARENRSVEVARADGSE